MYREIGGKHKRAYLEAGYIWNWIFLYLNFRENKLKFFWFKLMYFRHL